MKINLQNREETGKKVRNLRKSGMTPVVCYGSGEKSKNFSVNTRELEKLLREHTTVIELDGDAKGKSVLLQEVVYHPVTEIPIHVDFLYIDTKQEVEYEVPVNTIGEAPGVKLQGGLLILAHQSIEVKALPQDLPSSLEIDVSSLEEIGSHLYVKDLKLSPKVSLVTNGEEILVSIVQQEEEEEVPTSDSIDNIEVVSSKGKKEEEVVEDEDSK